MYIIIWLDKWEYTCRTSSSHLATEIKSFLEISLAAPPIAVSLQGGEKLDPSCVLNRRPRILARVDFLLV